MDLFEYNRIREAQARQILLECCETLLCKDIFHVLWEFVNDKGATFHDIDWSQSYRDKTTGKYYLILKEPVTYQSNPITIQETEGDKMAIHKVVLIRSDYLDKSFVPLINHLILFSNLDILALPELDETSKLAFRMDKEKFWVDKPTSKKKDDRVVLIATAIAIECEYNWKVHACIITDHTNFPLTCLNSD